MRKTLVFALGALICLGLSEGTVYAYLDPGSGSMMVQALLAAIAAVSVSLSMFWRRIRSFFEKLFSRRDEKNA